MQYFPYTNFHEINLDWILAELKKIRDPSPEVAEKIAEFEQSLSTAFNDISGLKTAQRYSIRKNYLDNSNFARPVNQRGLSRYDGGYGIDRWLTDGGVIEVVAGGVSVQNAPMKQYMEPKYFTNEEYTFAAMTISGDLVFRHGNPLNSFNVDSGLGMGVSDDKVVFSLPLGYTYTWASCYRGLFTEDTLPTYNPISYASDLAECQRYFRKEMAIVTVGTQYSGPSNGIIALIVNNMRTTPTITIDDISSQGWDGITPSVLSPGWTGNYGTSYRRNYLISGDESFVGQTIAVYYTANADL